jgi:3D-(3,5/4)-trihydroxycyclohexane-1,2-dione acylhydrolase (decyclizing)
VEVETDPLVPAPDSESWWDVPVAEVAQLGSTVRARKSYEAAKENQRPYL